MTVELRPLGELCNLNCTYCYQEPIRLAGNIYSKYSIDSMLKQLETVNQPFHLFGGEALLVPKNDLETLWKYGYEKYRQNGVQTNGTLIDDEHIELFKKYNVFVGISIDGPNELNSLREVRQYQRGTMEKEQKTLESTQLIIDNIRKLKRNNISIGIIITLHRQNASKERLPRLLSFIRWLGDIGVKSGNIHVLEQEATMPDANTEVLTQKENIEAFLTLSDFFKENKDLSWKPFTEMLQLVEGIDKNANCFWHFCDNFNTQAVYGIDGDGSLSNCGRTNKEGVGWYKADSNQYMRYVALYNTPQEYNGCKGCRFWMLCSGSCPGESIDGDYRNKTTNCLTMKGMLSYYEKEVETKGEIPITKSPLRQQIEFKMIEQLSNNISPSLSRIISELEENPVIIQVPVGELKHENT